VSGNKIGGRKAAAKNLANDPNFYKRIGQIGGSRNTTGGFKDKDLARRAGRLGGLKSRRGPVNKKVVLYKDNMGWRFNTEAGDSITMSKHYVLKSHAMTDALDEATRLKAKFIPYE